MSDFKADLRTESVVGKWMEDHFWKSLNGQRVEDLNL